MMNSVPAGHTGPLDPTVPEAYRDYLTVANGGIFSNVVFFAAEDTAGSQVFADTVQGAPVTLGREDWFCFGKIYEDPLFLKRSDGTVWGFPDQGITWWQSDVFEQWGKGLNTFLHDTVFGPNFQTATDADEDDPWLQVLRELDRLDQ